MPGEQRENLTLEEQTEKRIQELKASSQLVRLEKASEEFFFDSTDLNAGTEKELRQRLTQGWQITTVKNLPAFLPARQAQIKKEGLEAFNWGYKRQE